MNDELQSWKNKYYDALGELESKERSWSELEQFLRQGMSRLTLAADSSNDTLNQQLEKLRTLLRGHDNDARLRELLEQISDSIRLLDESRRSQAVAPKPAELLEELIGRITFPRGMGHRATALQKKMLQAGDSDYHPLVDDFVSLIGDALRWAAEEDDTLEKRHEQKGSGLLGRLFAKGEVERNEAESVEQQLSAVRSVLQSLIESLVVAPEQQSTFMQQLDRLDDKPSAMRLAADLAGHLKPLLGATQVEDEGELPSNEVLLRLIERMDIPVELSDETEAVKELLAEAVDETAMERAVAAIADLVTEMRTQVQNEKGEIENFLKQMTERLGEIDTAFRNNVATQRESFEGGRDLDHAVSAQMQGIEESVSLAEDIELLKLALRERVDTIRTHMQEFRTAEEERLQRAEQQVEQLTDRLQSVQQESDSLRKKLKEERDLAMIDPLTGIPNRFAYNERLAQEVARWRRYNSALVIAVWDVDRFKRINDTYGHQAGDKVLTVIAKLLNKQVRETDFVARYGGEEFVLLLPETDLEGAAVATEQIRKSVEQCEFHFRGSPVPITISCGMSQFAEGDTAEKVFARADAALYKAKESGRNQCRSA